MPPYGPGRFATTRWTLVVAAGARADRQSADALARLCEIYWHPVYALVRRQGHTPEESTDLTQEFFTRVLEKNYFQSADPARGRFRGFLCTSVRHFLANERDRARTLKRGGNQPVLSLDVETAEGTYTIEPRDDLTPEKLFDRRWALLMLDRVLGRVRDEYREAGRQALFDQLKGCLTGETDTPYQEIGRRLEMSEGAVKVAVHRLRRRFRDALTNEIADTVSDPREIQAEIEYLLKAVSA